MKTTIGIACFGSLNKCKHCVGSLIHLLDDPKQTAVHVVDYQGYWCEWLTRYVGNHVGSLLVECLTKNQGVPYAYNRIAKSAQTDQVIFAHNDLLVYEKGWDKRILEPFTRYDRIGVTGLAGARAVHHNGLRGEFWSNMLEAELHGSRGYGLLPVAVLDGMMLACSKIMLDQVGGFDERYTPHHFYDLDVCLSSHYAGFKNVLVGVLCHHLNGQTANQELFSEFAKDQGGDAAIHRRSQEVFNVKWASRLSLFVEDWINQ